jgi:hypothetical protein
MNSENHTQLSRAKVSIDDDFEKIIRDPTLIDKFRHVQEAPSSLPEVDAPLPEESANTLAGQHILRTSKNGPVSEMILTI